MSKNKEIKTPKVEKVKKRIPSEKEEKGNKVVIVIVIVTVVLLLVAGSIFCYDKYQSKKEVDDYLANITNTTSTEVDDMSQKYDDYTIILYQGEEYKYNTDITTVLFLGVDQKDVDETEGGEAGRTDTMILMLLDSSDESVTMLSISRDTIAEVDIVSESGKTILTGNMHLALQYSYGDGGSLSCQLSKNAISRLLYNIPINYYMAMDMDGIAGIVDGIGGLSITFEEDYTYINESFVEGTTLTLDGEEAESFVRYRDTDELGSNDDRMERQEVFVEAFVSQLKSKAGGDYSKLESMWSIMSPFLDTDLNVDTMSNLANYEMAEESYKVPGETVEGEEHDEYIVDEENLQKMLIELLYKLN